MKKLFFLLLRRETQFEEPITICSLLSLKDKFGKFKNFFSKM